MKFVWLNIKAVRETTTHCCRWDEQLNDRDLFLYPFTITWSQRFSFAAKRTSRQKRKRSGERKPLVVSDANLIIMLR